MSSLNFHLIHLAIQSIHLIHLAIPMQPPSSSKDWRLVSLGAMRAWDSRDVTRLVHEMKKRFLPKAWTIE